MAPRLKLFGLSAAVAAALALGSGATAASARCAHAGAHPHDVSLAKLREAITCLVNRERTDRGRKALKPNDRLRLAAKSHTKRMLGNDCLEHKCPGEVGLNRRVKRTGYFKTAHHWGFAEDLGYDRTPRHLVKRLLNDRFNRRKLLSRDFRDLGVGVGWGAPVDSADDAKFATYTLVFGWRRPKP